MDRALQASWATCLRALVAVALSLAVLNLVVAASASATVPTWLAPLDLSVPSQDASRPKVVIDQQGNATAAWERSNGSNWIIQSAERPAGGAWSEPVDLSGAGEDAEWPNVAFDPQGTATAVWKRFNGSNWIIQSAERPAGGAWSEPVDLSEAGEDATFPQVAVDSEGNATAVWRRLDSGESLIQSAERPAGGAWSEPVDLSEAGEDAGSGQVAVGPDGNAMAVWRRFGGGESLIQSAERVEGGTWSEPVDLSEAGQDADIPRVVVDGEGNATAVWERFDSGHWTVQGAERPAGGVWSEPVDLSGAGEDAQWPNVAFDPQGTATAVWQHFDGNASIVQSAERPAGSVWSEPADLSAAGQDALIPAVAASPEGNATTIWRRFNGSNWIIQSAERVEGGTETLGNTSNAQASTPVASKPTTSLRKGTLLAARIAQVVGSKALLRLYCRGEERCRGVVKLIASARKKDAKLDGRWRTEEGARHVLIGHARFSIPANMSRVIRVRLSGWSKRLLHRAHRHQLKVKLQGGGVNRPWVVLKEVRHRAGG